jgi:hypothetical protein
MHREAMWLPRREEVPTLYMITMTPKTWLSCANADRVSAPLDRAA